MKWDAKHVTKQFFLRSALLLSMLAGSMFVVDCNLDSSISDAPLVEDDPTTPPLSELVSLAISPAEMDLDVSETPVTTKQFKAVGTFTDGTMHAITRYVTFGLNNQRVGIFQAGQAGLFQSTGTPGVTTIYAYTGRIEASTTLTVFRKQTIKDDSLAGAPIDATSFEKTAETDPAKTPKVVYPYDHVMMPPNLGFLEVQWNKGNANNSLFEVRFQSRLMDYRVYTQCLPVSCQSGSCNVASNGCFYRVSPELWEVLAYGHAGLENGELTISVRGTQQSNGTVGSSTPIHMAFSKQNLEGGLYYWSTTGPTNGIYRINLETSTVEQYYITPQAPADNNGQKNCIGCHTISHDGKKMAVVLGGGHVSDLVQLDVATRTPTLIKINTTAPAGAARQYSNLQAYNQDGSLFASTLFGRMKIVDASTGNPILASVHVGAQTSATHPDWSHKGDLIAYTFYPGTPPSNPSGGGNSNDIFIQTGGIGLVSWNGTTTGDPISLVPIKSQQSSYYPSLDPSSRFVAFNQVSCIASVSTCSVYDNPLAKIYLKEIATANAEAELTNINQKGPNDDTEKLTNSWPKFSPFVKAGPGGKTLLWVTFSSKRNYGVRKVETSSDPSTRKPQLWMAAVLIDKNAVRLDPSYPPFWVPNQDLTTSNHIAQWTEKVIPLLP